MMLDLGAILVGAKVGPIQGIQVHHASVSGSSTHRATKQSCEQGALSLSHTKSPKLVVSGQDAGILAQFGVHEGN